MGWDPFGYPLLVNTVFHFNHKLLTLRFATICLKWKPALGEDSYVIDWVNVTRVTLFINCRTKLHTSTSITHHPSQASF